jgi:PAS domain S-box-containing protein
VIAKLAAIVESSDDAIIGKDLNGIITTWNRGAEQLFGYSEQEVIGQPVTMLMPPDRVHEEAVILERIRRGERIEHFETVRRRKDGTLLDISLSVSPIIDAHGNVTGASKIARDISERKQAEAALRESEERYRVLFEMSPVAVYSIDTSGVILNFNSHAAELWGRAPALGDTDERFCGSYRLFRPDGSFMPHEQCPMAEVVAGKIPEAREAEVLIERPDGSRVTVIVNIRPLKNERGKIIGAINCFYDISERKRAEEERERLLGREQAARQEAEAANRVKDQFLAVVSHELRTPLGSILMWTTMLKSGSRMDKLPGAIEVIDRNARLQLRLVEDLLDLNRVSRGEITLDEGVHDLCSAILLPSLESTRFNAEAKHVVVEFEGATEPALIKGDAVRLQQVFTNVLSNAVKFTPEGGSIRVSLTGEAESAVVKIRDTGVGIAPEFLPHVFEIFQQQESEIRTSHSGLGIGLALVKHLVDLHGGDIQIASEGSGLGTEVTVRLPRLVFTPETEISKKSAASSRVS